MSSNGTGSSKWPDFRLASTLRSLVPGLQPKRPDKQNNDNAAGHDHDNKQQHESEPQNELHEDLNLPSRMAHENMETEDQPIDGIGGLDSYDNDVQAGSDNDDQDQDFGVLEMFDSNATQAPYSSQLNNAPYDEKAPEALMTEEAPSSQTRKHKRDKKERKRKSTSDDASLQLLTEEDSSRKQRKSKKNSAQVAEIPDSLAEKNSSNAFQSLPQQISAVDLYDDDATPATPATQAKRKRNSSDSTDGKQRKKRRSRDDGVATESQDIVPETQEGAQSTLEGANTRDSPAPPFSRTRNAPRPGAIDDDVQENPPELPRSREGSAAPDEMDLDVSTAQGKQEEKGSGTVESHEVNGSQNTHNEDVERMAREAWNEHVINAQNNTNTQDSADQHDKIETPTSAQRQQTTQDVYDIPGSPLQTPNAPIASAKKSRTASAKTKKAKPTFFEKSPSPEQDDLAPLASPSATTQAPPKRAKKASNRKKSEANVMQAGQDEEEPRAAGARRDRMDNHTKGRFSEEELGRIAKAVEAYRSANDMEQYQLNTMIHAPGGTAAGEEHAAFWDRIFATCPDRHRQKIINITRKKFHNFVARGAWTTEQDQELRDLIEINGKKWSKIAGIINRHPEDLRDRYRNYIICGASQQKDRWTEEEEQKLVEVVMHTIDAIDQQRHDNPNDTRFQRPYVELIDWQTISEQMGRKRSRLQCMTKWKAMNIKTHVKDQLASAAPDASITFRLEKARRQIAAMPDEERYRMVLAIHNSSARIESKIPWQRLVDKTFRASWHRPTQMLLWRRLKRTVPSFHEKSVRDCATYLMDIYSQTGELPNVEDTLYDDAEEVEFVNSIPIGQINSSTPANGQNISAEYITEADEDGDEYQAGEEADEHQTGEYGMIDENIQPDLPIAPMEDYSPAPTASMDPVAPVADLAPMEPAEMVDPALSAEPMPLEEIEEEVPPSVEEQGLIDKPVGTPVFAEPAPPKATRVAKRTGFGKAKPPKAPRKSSARSTPVKSTPTRRSTRRAAAPSQDPIEDSEGTQPSAPADDDSEVEDAKTRKRKTPSRFRSTTTTELPTAADDSDSVMDDMEDMPARIR